MTIKQQGGIFGRNPTFNNVTVDGTLTVDQIVEKTSAAGITLDGVTLKDGNVVLADGKGIDFSATSGTGASELFDDYEEGTWTPTLYGSGGGSATIGTINLATYTKVGNTVHLVAYLAGIDLSAHTIVGNVRLGGLPYNAVQFSGVAAATFCNMFTFDEKTTGVSAYANINHFQLMQGSSALLITATELGTGATSVIMFSATYTAS